MTKFSRLTIREIYDMVNIRKISFRINLRLLFPESNSHVISFANPKCPVKMPEKPFIPLIFHDFSKRDNGLKRNISLVNRLFDREWRKKCALQMQLDDAFVPFNL